MKKLIIADDHELILDGLKSLLSTVDDVSIIDEASDGEELWRKIQQVDEVDMVILDINMPIMDGIEVTKLVKGNYPEIKIIVLSMYKRTEFVKNLVNAGADGYILKNSGKEILMEAIQTVYSGKQYFSQEIKETLRKSHTENRKDLDRFIVELSEREKEVVRLVVKEKSTAEIANELFLSIHTVNSHRKSILNKLGVKNAAGIFRYAVQNGIVKGFDW